MLSLTGDRFALVDTSNPYCTDVFELFMDDPIVVSRQMCQLWEGDGKCREK